MINRIFNRIVLILVLVGIGVGLYYMQQNNLLPKGLMPAPTAIVVTQPVQKVVVTPTVSISPSGKITPTRSAEEANIKVFAPRANDTVGRTFTITGEARVFENTFQIRVTNDQTKEVLFDKTEQTDAKDTGEFGNFQRDLNLAQSTLRSDDKLILEVFQYSAKDGAEIDKVTVPLVFQ